uniref:RluA family pseudouridine synthase n=2 Tax=Thaumasiovibrio subtropicus TaxID=1891207 RepID=UPI000B35EB12|nr:RluA family pseudouridine synthase [Thaumasiovibrio subtropicus]
MQDPMFFPFHADVASLPRPAQFTFPFCYQPHPMAIAASEALQDALSQPLEWEHDFGLVQESESATGKMFGVLVVENAQGELGYLRAYSGKVAESNHLPGFVPPVFDMLDEDGFFLPEQAEINKINHQLDAALASQDYVVAKTQWQTVANDAKTALSTHREQMQINKKSRKAQRLALSELPEEQRAEARQRLNEASVIDKLQLRDLKLQWEATVNDAKATLDGFENQIDALRQERKQRSHRLQKQLFAQYRFLNAVGEYEDLGAIFEKTPYGVPPAGAGECCAPKLLHYAYQHGYQPLALAEFWWGQSPKSEIRRHQHYYPSCQGKCHPILSHMLIGLDVEPSPLLMSDSDKKQVEIIYEDEHLAVINKPAEFLSVPGKSVNDSVYTRMKARYPDATGPLIVHRLDMSTSGLMVIAISARANKYLQQQFIQRTVKKRYCALLEQDIPKESGTISLPMRGDFYDRPRQLVCFEHGKPAETFYEVIERHNGKAKLFLYPKTGRTHQLRVHCAHVDGLNSPIVGDDLYGTRANRLHLHAESITFEHPITRETVHFQVDPDF